MVWKTKTHLKTQNTLTPKERQPLSLDRITQPHEDVNSPLVNVVMSKSIPIKALFVSGSGQDKANVHAQDPPDITRCVKSLQLKEHGSGPWTDGQMDQEKGQKHYLMKAASQTTVKEAIFSTNGVGTTGQLLRKIFKLDHYCIL